MMFRLALLSLLIIFSAPTPADDRVLMQEEVRDAEDRQQAELKDRIRDLEAQHKASKAIADKQQELIEALQAQIRALQENERERSSREE